MKIAIGLITNIFGALLVMNGIIIDNGVHITGGFGGVYDPTPAYSYLVGTILIVAGCVVLERGIKEK